MFLYLNHLLKKMADSTALSIVAGSIILKTVLQDAQLTNDCRTYANSLGLFFSFSPLSIGGKLIILF